MKLISDIVEYLSAVNDGPFARKGVGLQHFEEVFSIIFGKSDEQYLEKVKKCCKVRDKV